MMEPAVGQAFIPVQTAPGTEAPFALLMCLPTGPSSMQNTTIKQNGCLMFPAVTPFHFPGQDIPIPSHRLLSSDRITGQNASGEVTQKHRKKMKAKRRRWPNCQVVPASHPPAASFRLCPKCMGTHFHANPPLKVRLPARLISKEQVQPLLYLSTCSGCLRHQISKYGCSAIKPQPFCGIKPCSQVTKA